MTRHPVRLTTSGAALAVLAALGLVFVPPAPAAESDGLTVEKAARGKYLVATSGCMDCHTPMKMGPKGVEFDLSRMLSGHPRGTADAAGARAAAGSVARDLVGHQHRVCRAVGRELHRQPDALDPDTGLGQWTVQNFKDTIRTGRHMGRGRPVLPPMPIPVYNNFTDDDLESIFAYLRTIPPVKNRVPEPWAPADATSAKK